MPSAKPYRFHPEAWLEFEAADDWYLSRSFDASLGFLSEIDAALERISEAPQRWPKYLHGTRRLVVHRFPFSIVYLDDPDFVTIIASHTASESPDTGSTASDLEHPFSRQKISFIEYGDIPRNFRELRARMSPAARQRFPRACSTVEITQFEAEKKVSAGEE